MMPQRSSSSFSSLLKQGLGKLPIFLLILAALISTGESFGSINIFKHRYPFYGGYGYGYPYYYGGYGGYGGINLVSGGWGR